MDDFLIAIGLSLLCMVVFRALCRFNWVSQSCSWLGSHSYSYFLVHNFVIDRTIRLWVHQDLNLYRQSLPFMIIGTLGLALIVDWATPMVRSAAIAVFGFADRKLHQPLPNQSSSESPSESLSADRYSIVPRDR